jgi:hypothetical protein
MLLPVPPARNPHATGASRLALVGRVNPERFPNLRVNKGDRV